MQPCGVPQPCQPPNYSRVVSAAVGRITNHRVLPWLFWVLSFKGRVVPAAAVAVTTTATELVGLSKKSISLLRASADRWPGRNLSLRPRATSIW